MALHSHRILRRTTVRPHIAIRPGILPGRFVLPGSRQGLLLVRVLDSLHYFEEVLL